MRILFTGPVGSGKSTQAQLLAGHLQISIFQTGELTRSLAKEDSDLGKRVREVMEKGELVDDQTISEILRQAMAKVDLSGGFIVDGYPRSLEQLKFFDPGFDVVVNFKIPDGVVLERLIKRQRVDDTPEAINRRLKIYYGQTQPLIEYYRNLGILKEIDARGSVDDVQNSLRKALNVK